MSRAGSRPAKLVIMASGLAGFDAGQHAESGAGVIALAVAGDGEAVTEFQL
jgi:hypothetical protein